MTGKVYLVGAGPGDPELLTLKALRLLKSAGAVLHDDLVSPEILKLASPAAQLLNVGKRCGVKKITQEEINFLMVGLAGLGLDVVRLKGGDPLLFGRAGEEIESLRNAGIEYEIVPGITAALGAAAAANISLTHRDTSSALILLPGHAAGGRTVEGWRKFVRSGATLVVYMPGHDYTGLAARLREAGVRTSMPCAIVSRATTKHQRVERITVGQLPRVTPLPAPSLLIVGEVVRFAASRDAWQDPSQFPATVSFPNLAGLVSQTRRTAHDEESIA